MSEKESLTTNIKNLAIVAHVDHGKTTLVDGLLRQSGAFSEREEIVERVMDSGELERERGITINAKNCAIFWKNHKINLLDTPGHADFGAEVERSLMMVDAVLLLVDAAEGPLPQTRFVLTKAMERGLRIAACINKVDRPDRRIREVESEIEDLLLDLADLLGLEDFDLDVPILYSSAKEGWATVTRPSDDGEVVKGDNLIPILDSFVSDFFPYPKIDRDLDAGHFQLLVTNLSYSQYLGALAVGRIQRGSISKHQRVVCLGKDKREKQFQVSSVQVFGGTGKQEVDTASAGEIVLISGLDELEIGDTIASPENPDRLERVSVAPPTVSVSVSVSTSPLSGQEGEYLTSRKLEDFLSEASRKNVALAYEATSDPKVFNLKGRGELQLAIVFEELRRKGFEFMLSRPSVIYQEGEDGKKLEPFERLTVDLPTESTGTVTEKLNKRKGRMESMNQLGEGRTRMEFLIPSRGLIGFRSQFLTDTRGEGLMSSTFAGHQPYSGDMLARANGALVADRTGKATAYALFNLLSLGELFVSPGERLYEGMVVGEHKKVNDLNINAVREKHLSSVRTAGKDEYVILPPLRQRTLDWAMSWIDDQEWIEVTPENLRIRKKALGKNERSVIRGG